MLHTYGVYPVVRCNAQLNIMNKYKEAIFPIIKDVNVNVYRIARALSVLGILILLCSAVFLEFGTLSKIMGTAGFVFMALPFVLKFAIDSSKIIGVIKLTEFEIITKFTIEEPMKFDIKNIDNLEFVIVDYEGESKIRDVINSDMSIRPGTENEVSWRKAGTQYQFKFKIATDHQKRKAIFFAKRYEEQST